MKKLLQFLLVLLVSCDAADTTFPTTTEIEADSVAPAPDSLGSSTTMDHKNVVALNAALTTGINTGTTTPEELITYAKTLIGTPYRYGSIDPAVGFDCSGFITHVFNHFNIKVPRSSRDFTNEGTEVDIQEARPGDLVLFTGTDSTIRDVGHMGIITENDNHNILFIHSTSGKAQAVTITPMNKSYLNRFVKIIRVFH
jgi:cell wall-associated NlpC family hydrolase